MVKEYSSVIHQSTIYCSGCTSGSREKSEVIQIVFFLGIRKYHVPSVKFRQLFSDALKLRKVKSN